MTQEVLLLFIALTAQHNGVQIPQFVWILFVLWVIQKFVIICVTSLVKVMKDK